MPGTSNTAVITPEALASWDELRDELVGISQALLGADVEDHHRTAWCRRVCASVVTNLWEARSTDLDGFETWDEGPHVPLPFEVRRLSRQLGESLAAESLADTAYRVGNLYTVLLPRKIRASLGAYYTPPPLSERLLDLASTAGVDWSEATILDPACGGGAFLAPVAGRILSHHRIQALTPEQRLRHLETHVFGVEIDPFAAWLTKSLLRLMTTELAEKAGRFLEPRLDVGDALKLSLEDSRRFDLVIGNPPYGRIQLSDDLREKFARSLYGHANLYGLFLDAALRWKRSDGLIAFLTPTSFLGGQYFSRLRDLLLQEAPLLSVDFLEPRTGVFESVQQETCLTVFGPNSSTTTVVHRLKAQPRSLRVERVGVVPLAQRRKAPWLLPRTPRQSHLIETALAMPTRLVHLGYRASTGQLVWNRHKSQLRKASVEGSFPLIWAEAVQPNAFRFEYRNRSHAPFFQPAENQQFLLTTRPCVLVQRTTAKEQNRRLIACAVPEGFLAQWGGMVVENHVNVITGPRDGRISPEALAIVLGSDVVDQIFRCLSGSVAVSVTELHALPLPPPECFEEVERLLREEQESPTFSADVEGTIRTYYGLAVDE